jgi:Flp pilus assembly protein TadD
LPVQAEAEIAELQLSLGQTREAIRTAQRAARLEVPTAVRVSGLAYYRERDWNNAVRFLARSSALSPGDVEVWSALADASLRVAALPEAIEAARMALRLRPGDRGAARVLACALVRTGGYNEATVLCEAHGWDLLPHTYLARLMMDTGQLEQACQFIRLWVDRRPRDSSAWMHLAYLSERMGRFRDALYHYRQAWLVSPGNNEARRRYLQLKDALDSGEFPPVHAAPETY